MSISPAPRRKSAPRRVKVKSMKVEIFSYLFPGMMVMWVFFIANSVMSDIYNEFNNKTLMRMMASPISVTQIVLSKFIHSFMLSLLVEFVLIVLTTLIFGMDWGNPFWLLIAVLAINLAMTGVLAFIHGVSKTKGAADGLSVIVILFLGFLSGCFFPFESMPKLFQQIGEWTVNRWAVLSLQYVMKDKPIPDLWMQLWKLGLAGLVTLSGGVYFLRRRLTRGEGV